MRTGNKLWTITTLLFFALGISGFSAQLTNFTKGFPDLTGSGSLYVKLDQGDVTIKAGAGSVNVEVYGIDQRELGFLNVRESGTDVYVEFDVDGRSYSELKVEIGIPADFNIDVKTAGGDIAVTGDLRGMAKVKTAGGDINMDNVYGETEVKTAGGDIDVGAIEADAWISTAGGDIKVESVGGVLEVNTSGGDIVVGNIQNRLKASTAGGDIELGNVGGDAVIKTSGGDIVVGDVAGAAEMATAGGDIALGSASGKVTAKTAGGDLELRNITGSLEAATAGGDIEAELTPGSAGGASSLKTAGGDIRLYLPAGANVRIDAEIKISGRWERESEEYGIFSDFPEVQMQKDSSGKVIRAQTDLNGGGQTITLRTHNGNIYIKNLPR